MNADDFAYLGQLVTRVTWLLWVVEMKGTQIQMVICLAVLLANPIPKGLSMVILLACLTLRGCKRAYHLAETKVH